MSHKLYPLTEPQKTFVKIEQANSDTPSLYTIYSFVKYPKTANLTTLDKVINKIYELNDSTRIRFIKDEKTGEYLQYIDEYSYKPTEIITSDSDNILDVINNIKNTKFSINGELNKICIAQLPSYTYTLVIFHHILSDGYGLTNIGNQLKFFYYAIENNLDLDTFPISSYTKFIEREQEYLQSSRFKKDEQFWQEYVKNIEPTTLFKNNNMYSKQAKRYEYKIPNNISTKIEEYCRKNKITEYSFYLAIISIYFNYIHNVENITIGTPFLNRQKRNDEFSDTGLHISTLPLNINININSDFITLCNTINSSNLALFRHGAYSYNNIQKLYKAEKNSNTNLYEIGFSYQIGVSEQEIISQDYQKEENDGVGDCVWIFSECQTDSLTFHITQLNTQKIFSIDYVTSIFEDNEIEKMNLILFNLINQVLNGITKLDKYEIFLEDDIKLLAKFNSTGNIEKSTKTVIDYFEEVVNKHPNKTALICNNKQLTYSELNNKVNCLANLLLENKIKKNTPVALLFDKSFDMIISILAVLKIGCYYVPILPDENINRISYIINDCSPSCILTHNNYENIVSDFGISVLNLDNYYNELNEGSKYLENLNLKIYNSLNNCSKEVKCKTLNSNNLAYMIYTSGSTGNPKGVQIMHKNITSFIESMKINSDLKPYFSDVCMSLLKYSFDASGIDIYSALLIGGTLLIVSKADELNPIKVLELIEKYKVTRSFLIPKWIEHIVQTSLNYNFNISSLKLLGTGGEILKPNLLKQFTEKYPNIKIANLYGPSEATMFTTYKIISKQEIENNHSTIGVPIPGSRIAIINSNNIFMPTNTEGELIVYEDNNSIENIAKGYLNLEEQTNKKFIKIYNPMTKTMVKAYKTGDFAKITNNLEIEFIGRKDDIVKVNGGYLVAINEVEKRINNLLNNIESYAVAVPYKNTKAIVLFVKMEEKSISLNNIKTFLKNNLSFYMQPKKIIEMAETPRISSGKVDRQKLKQFALEQLKLQTNNIVKPKTELEIEIYEIVKNLINIDEFSITDDFIDDLGIDSLSLTSLSVALKKYNLNMQDFYTNSNIQNLASFIENKKKTNCLEIESAENVHIINNSSSFDLSTVLLTGATGFLGIHLLRELLLSPKTKKIYCIIRNKIGIEGNERLLNLVDYYFKSNEKMLKLISEKVVVLNGDITENYFNLDKDVYSLLQSEVKTVINSAANVKHFEKPEQIKKDNVLSCDNIIEFCGNTISLAHMSTLSVAGFKEKNTLNSVFNENSLYIKQGFRNNAYLISKFNAEIHILSAIENNGLDAKIFRLGNIMLRSDDGKFQKNATQNIFITAMKTIFNIRKISRNMLDFKIEFSPVDECAKSIMYLMGCSGNSVYHILNNNMVSVQKLVSIFEKYTQPFNIVSHNKFIDEVIQNSDEYVKEYILGTNLNEYSEKKTLKALKDFNFNWNKTDSKYINQVIQKFRNIS